MKKGRVTIPTNLDVVPQTLEMLDEWGADAIRDCDGTEFPQELKETGAKIYATYYTTRKDNAWAKASDGSSVSGYAGSKYERRYLQMVGSYGSNHRRSSADNSVELCRRNR